MILKRGHILGPVLILAACVAWWTFYRNLKLTVFLFDMERNPVVSDVRTMFWRRATITGCGLACLMALVLSGIWLSRKAATKKPPLTGAAAVAAKFALTVVAAVAGGLTLREAYQWPWFAPSFIATLAFGCLFLLADLLRSARGNNDDGRADLTG
jgi:hypothetical protein